MPDIRFTELADELNITTKQLAKLRDEKLSSGEYYVGKDNLRYFTESGAEKLRLAVAVPLAVPTKAHGRVIKPARNPRWVYAVLENIGVETLVPVAIPRRLYGRLIGKPITVDIIKDANGGVSYRHEDLGA